jgi:outer membrane protein OmpA-like peptidoglycan-associated protein
MKGAGEKFMFKFVGIAGVELLAAPCLNRRMPRTGKCQNYAACLLAYRGDVITVPDGAEFVCPDCKRPLLSARADGKKPIALPMIILGGISLLVIMGATAVYIQVRHFRETQATGQIGTSFEQAQIAAEHGEFMPSRHMPAIADTPSPAPSGESAAPPVTSAGADSGIRTQTPNLNLQDSQNQRVKTDVLKRIDLMPTITAEEKDKLYMSVERARQMGKIITIPFPSGHVALGPNDVDQLRGVLASAQLKPFLTDPTCVLVVLGFADMKGDEKANLHISTERAQSVLNALRDQCGVLNVMHAVGMGGSTLFGNEQDAERNRVVEIWAVLP